MGSIRLNLRTYRPRPRVQWLGYCGWVNLVFRGQKLDLNVTYVFFS